MTKTKAVHPIEIHPEYLAELRRRIETGPGFGAVAEAAGMSKTTLWRVLHGRSKQRITVDAVERARLGLAFLEEGVPPMPPPLLPVQGSVHHAWMALGERLLREDPEIMARAVGNADETLDAIRQRIRKNKLPA